MSSFIGGSLIIVLSVLSPIAGIITGLLTALFSRRTNVLAIMGVALAFSVFGLHYVFAPTDDMARYVQYMDHLSNIQSLPDYLKQVYSSIPISVFGLNGKTWPVSGALMYITSRYFSYQVLAAVSVGVTIFVRIFSIVKVTEKGGLSTSNVVFLRIFLIAVDVMVATLLRPASGFRWYIATSIILLLLTADVVGRRVPTIFYIFSAVTASLIHPAGWMYVAIRFGSSFISRGDTKLLKKILGGLVVAFLVILILFGQSENIQLLIAQFTAYTTNNSSFTVSLLDFVNFALWALGIFFIWNRVRVLGNLDSLNYINMTINVFFALASLPFYLFDRLYQMTIPMLLIFYGSSLAKQKNLIWKDVFVLSYLLALIVVYYFLNSGLVVPKLDNQGMRIMFLPIWHYLIF